MSTINKLRDRTGYKTIMVSDGKLQITFEKTVLDVDKMIKNLELRIEALEKRVKELKLTKGTKQKAETSAQPSKKKGKGKKSA